MSKADEDSAIEETDGARSSAGAIALLPDPGFLWQVFRRNLFLFFVTVSTIIALTALFLMLQVPGYTTTASLLVEPTGEPVRTTGPQRRMATHSRQKRPNKSAGL